VIQEDIKTAPLVDLKDIRTHPSPDRLEPNCTNITDFVFYRPKKTAVLEKIGSA